MTTPQFGTVAFYDAVAEDLNNDPTWLDMAVPITYTMVFVYEPPVDKRFFLRFEEGRITEVGEIDDADTAGADFVIAGKPEAWKGIIAGEISPNAAMATGKVKVVQGKQTVLLRHLKKFAYMINKMSEIEAVFS